MSARQLAQLLYLAEDAAPDQKDAVLFAEECGIVCERKLLAFLSYLTDPAKDRQVLATSCELVRDDLNLNPFWRALAAHHRALAARPPEDPNGFFPAAVTIADSIWYEPLEDTEGLNEEETRAAKARNNAKKDLVTPEASYIYQYRMRDRARFSSVQPKFGTLLQGSTIAVTAGWFEAPEWTHQVCDLLVADGKSDQARQLMSLFIARSLKPHCYFSRLKRALLIASHGALLAT